MTKTTFNDLTEKDIQQLHGFFMHVWSVKQGTTKADFRFYAQLLDDLNIGWHIQNTAAQLAENRNNMFLYFTPLLQKAVA